MVMLMFTIPHSDLSPEVIVHSERWADSWLETLHTAAYIIDQTSTDKRNICYEGKQFKAPQGSAKIC